MGEPVARQEDQVRVLLLGFALSEQADKACKTTCIEFQFPAPQHNALCFQRPLSSPPMSGSSRFGSGRKGPPAE